MGVILLGMVALRFQTFNMNRSIKINQCITSFFTSSLLGIGVFNDTTCDARGEGSLIDLAVRQKGEAILQCSPVKWIRLNYGYRFYTFLHIVKHSLCQVAYTLPYFGLCYRLQ